MAVLAAMFVVASLTHAQVVSQDSMKVLNNEKEILKIAGKVNDKKLKLAKLENQVAERQSDIEKTKVASDKATQDNQDAASKLSDDAQDKSKAKAARKAASNAESSAKKARKAVEKLDDLNKDIEDLKKEISQDESKLSSLGGDQYIKTSN